MLEFPYLNIAVLGAPGTGKTHAICVMQDEIARELRCRRVFLGDRARLPKQFRGARLRYDSEKKDRILNRFGGPRLSVETTISREAMLWIREFYSVQRELSASSLRTPHDIVLGLDDLRDIIPGSRSGDATDLLRAFVSALRHVRTALVWSSQSSVGTATLLPLASHLVITSPVQDRRVRAQLEERLGDRPDVDYSRRGLVTLQPTNPEMETAIETAVSKFRDYP